MDHRPTTTKKREKKASKRRSISAPATLLSLPLLASVAQRSHTHTHISFLFQQWKRIKTNKKREKRLKEKVYFGSSNVTICAQFSVWGTRFLLHTKVIFYTNEKGSRANKKREIRLKETVNFGFSNAALRAPCSVRDTTWLLYTQIYFLITALEAD